MVNHAPVYGWFRMDDDVDYHQHPRRFPHQLGLLIGLTGKRTYTSLEFHTPTTTTTIAAKMHQGNCACRNKKKAYKQEKQQAKIKNS